MTDYVIDELVDIRVFDKLTRKKTKVLREGGFHSGNYGHAGIPGHRGGSQPTGEEIPGKAPEIEKIDADRESRVRLTKEWNKTWGDKQEPFWDTEGEKSPKYWVVRDSSGKMVAGGTTVMKGAVVDLLSIGSMVKGNGTILLDRIKSGSIWIRALAVSTAMSWYLESGFKKVGGHENQYNVEWTRSSKEVAREGGQGSGNIGHAGIPGHQGGSQPTGVKGPLERSDKENEQWSLDFYTSDGVGSMDMNRDLRSGKPLEPLRQKEADGIKSLCSHSTPGVDKVYRGMIVKDRGTAEKMFPNGREIIDKGIMSTSAKLEFAKEFTTEKSGYRVLMFIDVPKGAHGYRWNDPNDNFDEVILPSGTRLHIRSCALHRDDCYVYAEIVK